MKRIVIFDLDGTLLNTIDDLAAATNHALACCGYPVHPVSAYPYFVGNGIDKLFERALPPDARSATEIARMRASFVPYTIPIAMYIPARTTASSICWNACRRQVLP